MPRPNELVAAAGRRGSDWRQLSKVARAILNRVVTYDAMPFPYREHPFVVKNDPLRDPQPLRLLRLDNNDLYESGARYYDFDQDGFYDAYASYSDLDGEGCMKITTSIHLPKPGETQKGQRGQNQDSSGSEEVEHGKRQPIRSALRA